VLMKLSNESLEWLVTFRQLARREHREPPLNFMRIPLACPAQADRG
jgi:hypothetical protein